MSIVRPAPFKSSGTSTIGPPLPTLPKVPFRLQSKCIPNVAVVSKADVKTQENGINAQANLARNQNELDDIAHNLSSIIKRSEKLLTPIRQPQITTNIRRSSSLRLTKTELDRRKLLNATPKSCVSNGSDLERKDNHPSKLHDSISDKSSECGTSVSTSVPRRTSIRPLHNIETYSGIKCTLPSFTSTIPHAFKGLEKHYTPIRTKEVNVTSSSMNNEITPANSIGREKSPWRLRFEKFLKHEEPTPLSPSTKPVVVNQTKVSSLSKENRTPSFRLSTRRTSKFNLPS